MLLSFPRLLSSLDKEQWSQDSIKLLVVRLAENKAIRHSAWLSYPQQSLTQLDNSCCVHFPFNSRKINLNVARDETSDNYVPKQWAALKFEELKNTLFLSFQKILICDLSRLSPNINHSIKLKGEKSSTKLHTNGS